MQFSSRPCFSGGYSAVWVLASLAIATLISTFTCRHYTHAHTRHSRKRLLQRFFHTIRALFFRRNFCTGGCLDVIPLLRACLHVRMCECLVIRLTMCLCVYEYANSHTYVYQVRETHRSRTHKYQQQEETEAAVASAGCQVRLAPDSALGRAGDSAHR